MYIALPDQAELPGDLRAYLAAPLHARALDLECAAELANQIAPEAAPRLRDAARTLAASAARLAAIEDYIAAWHEADQPVEAALTAIENANRTSMGAGAPDTLSRILRLIAGETL
jgi:hypothetical protein